MSQSDPPASVVAAMGWRRALVAVLWFALLTPCTPLAAAEPIASDVRLGVHEGFTRFVLTLDAPVRYEVFTLANPYRVVVDLPAIDWRIRGAPEALAAGVVSALRFGRFAPQTARVVLDATGPVAVKRSFVLGGRGENRRLVVDIAPVSAGEYAEQNAAAVRTPQPERMLPLPVARPDTLRQTGRRVVVIDAGHGGVDPGAVSRAGVHEKTITLKVALALARTLERSGRYRPVLTREEDIFLALRERVAFARAAAADVFLSIHADEAPSPRVAGASVYTLSETASDAEAEALATKENKSDIIGGFDLSNSSDQLTSILISLAQRATMNDSARLAQLLVDRLVARMPVVRRTHRFAGFAVLKAPDVPSVLIELGYLSNPRDEARLRSRRGQDDIVNATLEALDAYFAQTGANGAR